MAQFKRYTKEEDDIIFKCIKDFPHSKLDAFAKAASLLNRGASGVAYHYRTIMNDTTERPGGRHRDIIPFSKEEDEIILQYIAKFPNNLKYAAEKAAEQLSNRNRKSVLNRWYNVLKHATPIYGLISPQGAVANVKNTQRPKEDGSVLTIAKLAINRLSKKERMEIVEYLMTIIDR